MKEEMIDLRSDTVTHPSRPMRQKMFDSKLGDDGRNLDPTAIDLQKKAAKLFDLSASLLFPSGTMSNQTGLMSLDDGRILVKADRYEGDVRISIIDNGKGICQNDLPHVFKDGFTIGKSKGSGIGLFHAKEIIEKNYGSIMIDSLKGQGTTVQIILKISGYEINLASPNVVIVDDDDSVLWYWQNRLRESNINIKSFSRLDEFNSALVNGNLMPSTLIIDYHFEGSSVTGLNLAIKYKDRFDRIYLMSTDENNSELRRACKMHGIPFLPKSFRDGVSIIHNESTSCISH